MGESMKKKILLLIAGILVIGGLFIAVNYGTVTNVISLWLGSEEPLKEHKVIEGKTTSAPQKIIQIANNYIISLVGSDYFQQNFILVHTVDSGGTSPKDSSRYVVEYQYSLGNKIFKTTVRLDESSSVILYTGPTSAIKLNISKEQAIEIAEDNGLEGALTADLVSGKNGFISDGGVIYEEYLWSVWTDRMDENYSGKPQQIYIDVKTGDILGIKTYEYYPVIPF